MPNKGGSTNERQIISSRTCNTGCADVACDSVRSNRNASPYRNPHQPTCADPHSSATDGHTHTAHPNARAAYPHTHTAHTNARAADADPNPTNRYAHPSYRRTGQSSGKGLGRHGL